MSSSRNECIAIMDVFPVKIWSPVAAHPPPSTFLLALTTKVCCWAWARSSRRIVEMTSLDSSMYIRGQPYAQLFHSYPVLKPIYFSFEKQYNPLPILDFMASNNYSIPITVVIVYLSLCYYGTNYMKNRKSLNIGSQLATWNLLLALFSIYGTIRTLPHFLHKLSAMTFEESVCESAATYFGAGAAGLSVQLFILSKIPELFDTAFIILRKKPLIFLHWYHHVTVLLYCWNSYVTESGAGIYFVTMNYAVHAIMYTYYYLHAIKRLPNWFRSWIVTSLQILQMIIGTCIVTASLYYYIYGGRKYAPKECNNNLSNVIVGVVIYSSYLFLFLEYATKRFVYGAENSSVKGNKKLWLLTETFNRNTVTTFMKKTECSTPNIALLYIIITFFNIFQRMPLVKNS